MAITPASQAGDVSSILITRSIPQKNWSVLEWMHWAMPSGERACSDTGDFSSVVLAPPSNEINLVSDEQGMVQ